MLTYAQNFEDVMLARLFGEQEKGFYIDIGACHPESLSVTKHFYDLGWFGINVEPIPANHRLFQEARPRDININAAIDTKTGERIFYEVSEFNALSTFDPIQAEFLRQNGYHLTTYPVKTIRCDDLFEQYIDCTIDFLKIDVEGSEESVLRSLDLARFRPIVLLIEATLPARGFPGWADCEKFASWDWEGLVTDAGYIFAHFDGISRYYVRNENSHLISRFKLPPGYFDDIHFVSELRSLQQATAESEARLGLIHQQHAEMAELRQQLDTSEADRVSELRSLQQATAESEARLRLIHQQHAEMAELRQQLDTSEADRVSELRSLQQATAESEARLRLIHQQQAEMAELRQQLDTSEADRVSELRSLQQATAESEARLGLIHQQQAQMAELRQQLDTSEADRVSELRSLQQATAESEARLGLIHQQQAQMAELRQQLDTSEAD